MFDFRYHMTNIWSQTTRFRYINCISLSILKNKAKYTDTKLKTIRDSQVLYCAYKFDHYFDQLMILKMNKAHSKRSKHWNFLLVSPFLSKAIFFSNYCEFF